MLECSDLRAYQCTSIKRFALGEAQVAPLLAGSITSIKPGPFRIGTREYRAQSPCRSPAALQGLSGIGTSNKKTPALHIGRRCSIRGKRGHLARGEIKYDKRESDITEGKSDPRKIRLQRVSRMIGYPTPRIFLLFAISPVMPFGMSQGKQAYRAAQDPIAGRCPSTGLVQ
jgi:hypothetical protein